MIAGPCSWSSCHWHESRRRRWSCSRILGRLTHNEIGRQPVSSRLPARAGDAIDRRLSGAKMSVKRRKPFQTGKRLNSMIRYALPVLVVSHPCEGKIAFARKRATRCSQFTYERDSFCFACTRRESPLRRKASLRKETHCSWLIVHCLCGATGNLLCLSC